MVEIVNLGMETIFLHSIWRKWDLIPNRLESNISIKNNHSFCHRWKFEMIQWHIQSTPPTKCHLILQNRIMKNDAKGKNLWNTKSMCVTKSKTTENLCVWNYHVFRFQYQLYGMDSTLKLANFCLKHHQFFLGLGKLAANGLDDCKCII